MMSNMAVRSGPQFEELQHPMQKQSGLGRTQTSSIHPRNPERSKPQHFNAALPSNSSAALTLDTEKAWQQVLARDRSAKFFYGVKSTGIYCRPSCPSRRPTQQGVNFFPTPAQAEAAGFRACLRCHPVGPSLDASVVAAICRHLEANFDRKVTLAELARVAKASPFTVQRIVQRVLGISPLQYQRELRAAALRKGLTVSSTARRGQAATVTSAIYEAGYSSPSAVYGKTQLGMKPAKFKTQGAGESITFATAPCELGVLLVATTVRGICTISLGDDAASLENKLRERFPAAQITADNRADVADDLADASSVLSAYLRQVLSQMTSHPATIELPFDVQATAFQTRVWQALRTIPRGETRSYSEIARELGTPNAVRAVATACASNPVALVVPCHRVIGSNGKLTGYRWGLDRKRRLLAIESGIPRPDNSTHPSS
ncbi:MAG TPA: methylated-DNA--[protein]-cysteine S-methyltransferase [Acidisarcina sp.]